MPCSMAATHSIQRTTALDPRRCDYSIEKAFSNRQTGSILVHFNIFLQCFDMLAFKKKLLFPSLAAFKQSLFFSPLLDVRLKPKCKSG